MKKYYLILALAAILVSCAKNDVALDEQPIAVSINKVYASIGDDTRVQLNQELKSVWNAGDEITIIGPKEYSQWSFDGKTGDRVGVFSRVETFEPMLNKVNKYFAIYPGMGNIDYSQTTATNAEIITQLRDKQDYVKGTYCPKANVMFGTSADGSSYQFKNIVSYLRLSITCDPEEPKTVKSIDLLGNNGETLAGRMYINSENGSTSFRGDDVTTVESITLNCGNGGVQLSETPQEFYFVVPVVSCYKGITVCVNFTDGSTYMRSTTKSINFRPNYIHPMAVFSVDEEVEWQSAYITHYGERAVMPKVIGSAAVSGFVVWGDGNVSMFNEENDHVYTDGQDKHIITVQAAGAHQLELKHCTGVSHIDLTNF